MAPLKRIIPPTNPIPGDRMFSASASTNIHMVHIVYIGTHTIYIAIFSKIQFNPHNNKINHRRIRGSRAAWTI